MGEESGDAGQRLPESAPSSAPAKASKAQALSVPTQERTFQPRAPPSPNPAVCTAHWAVMDGQDQSHSPSHMLAILMQMLHTHQVSLELSEDSVVLKTSVFLFLLFLLWPCHTACRMLVPQPGIEPWAHGSERAQSPNQCTTRKLPKLVFFKVFDHIPPI